MFADAAEHTWLEELGGMNVYLITTDGEIVTPELTGSILEGVTRDSILTLASEWGLTPVERRISVAETLEGLLTGPDHREMFACGTAAVITPIASLHNDEDDVVGRLRRDRRDHRGAAQGADGHPVRPRRGHPRLAAADRLTSTGPRIPIHLRMLPPRRDSVGVQSPAEVAAGSCSELERTADARITCRGQVLAISRADAVRTDPVSSLVIIA